MHGYKEVESPDEKMLLFEHPNMIGCGGRENKFGRGPVRLVVEYEQGRVTSKLNHSRLGRTTFSRQVQSHNMLEEIFNNPNWDLHLEVVFLVPYT